MNLSNIEIDLIITEIITGKRVFEYDGKIFALKHPSSKEKDSARLVYTMKIQKCIAAGIPTREDLKYLALRTGLLDRVFYFKKRKIEENIDKLVDAREITGSSKQLIEIESLLQKSLNELQELEIKEEMVMLNSAESCAEESRIDFIISQCLLMGIELDKKYWDSYESFCKDTDNDMIAIVRSMYHEMSSGMSSKILRAVARSDEWKKRWDVSKVTNTPVFEGTSANWDRNKVELCYWSSFYDNIYEYGDLPDKKIIEDDDKLFDWIRKVNSEARKGSGKKEKSGVTNEVNTPYKVRI